MRHEEWRRDQEVRSRIVLRWTKRRIAWAFRTWVESYLEILEANELEEEEERDTASREKRLEKQLGASSILSAVDVESAHADTRLCEVHGHVVEAFAPLDGFVEPGAGTDLTVVVKDSHGNLCEGVVEVLVGDSKVAVIEVDDGLYEAAFNAPATKGHVLVSVLVGGQEIGGSPFELNVGSESSIARSAISTEPTFDDASAHVSVAEEIDMLKHLDFELSVSISEEFERLNAQLAEARGQASENLRLRHKAELGSLLNKDFGACRWIPFHGLATRIPWPR